MRDTYNLLGHALRKAVRLIAQASGHSREQVAKEIQLDALVTGTSLKAALDLNWDDPTERSIALDSILNALDRLESELQKKTEDSTLNDAQEVLEVARQIQSQNVTTPEPLQDYRCSSPLSSCPMRFSTLDMSALCATTNL